MTTRWASSNAMRNPAGMVWGLGALGWISIRWPALTRAAGSSARSPSRVTLPVVQSARTSLQLSPARRCRNAAASVTPASVASSSKACAGRRSATDEIEHFRQCRVESGEMGAAPLCHVGPAAPLAADGLGHLTDDLAGVMLTDEIGRNHGHESDLLLFDAGQDDDAGAELVAQLIGDLAQRLGIGDVGAGRQHAHAVHLARLGDEVASAARGELAAQLIGHLAQGPLFGL